MCSRRYFSSEIYITSVYFKNFRICFDWCCILYCAFSAFVIRESSLPRWDPIFWLRSNCFGWKPLLATEPLSGSSAEASATLSADVSTVITSSAVDSGLSSLSCFSMFSSGLWCGVPPRELTFTLSNVPRLPQTFCEMVYFTQTVLFLFAVKNTHVTYINERCRDSSAKTICVGRLIKLKRSGKESVINLRTGKDIINYEALSRIGRKKFRAIFMTRK